MPAISVSGGSITVPVNVRVPFVIHKRAKAAKINVTALVIRALEEELKTIEHQTGGTRER
jgi:post-segregation antitoxin (ccd killing protein)